MKIRSLALALALGCAVTTVAEARKKPAVYRATQKARKSKIYKYKLAKHNKVTKSAVKRRKHTA